MKKIMMFLIACTVSISLYEKAAAFNTDEMKAVDIHGWISQGYLQTSDNNFMANTKDGTFEFNDMGINFTYQATDKLRMGIQFFARDLGKMGNDEILLDWAVGDYRWKDWLGIRAGKIKTPHGFYNETRDMDMFRTNIFLPYSVYPEYARDSMVSTNGVGVYGTVGLKQAGSLLYQALVGASNVDKESGVAMSSEDGRAIDITNIEVKRRYASSLQWLTPLEGLRVGMTFERSIMDVKSKMVPPPNLDLTVEFEYQDSSVYSIEYTGEQFVLAAEYLGLRQKSQMTGLPFPIPENVQNYEGYYGSGSYRFTDWFELGAYYSETFTDVDDRDTDGNFLKDWALSTRFDINDNWIAKLEGHLMDGTAFYNIQYDNPDVASRADLEQEWFLFAAKITYSF